MGPVQAPGETDPHSYSETPIRTRRTAKDRQVDLCEPWRTTPSQLPALKKGKGLMFALDIQTQE